MPMSDLLFRFRLRPRWVAAHAGTLDQGRFVPHTDIYPRAASDNTIVDRTRVPGSPGEHTQKRYGAISPMRTSLDALPPKKQQQLATLVELIRSEVDVEMIILFGSHARGDWVQDPVGGYFSDFDVLVVTEKSAAVERHKLWSKIEDRAERFLQPATLSLIVHDIEDVNQQLEKGFYFFSDVKQEGIMLYDSQRFTLADAKKLSPQERRD